MGFVRHRQAVGKAGWNPALAGKEQTINARLYKYDKRAALLTDRIAAAKAAYEDAGPARSNVRYGYVMRSRG